jgi:hypothetical protein
MLKYILMLLVLTSCATTESVSPKNEEVEYRLKQLESLVMSHGFFIDTDRCFIDYLMCKNQNKEDKKCWGVHEQCVINVYRTYERLKKKQGG